MPYLGIILIISLEINAIPTSKGVTVKAILPKEVKPGDVVNKKDDLEIVYDAQEGCYTAYGRFKLKPNETLERDIEINNVWVIPDSEIEDVKKDLAKLSDMLVNTRFSDRFALLKNGIESKLSRIIESQKVLPSNPEQLISNYRENLKILESAQADLVLIRSFLTQLRIFPATTIWSIIILIIVFLGLLSIVFFIIWQNKAKDIPPQHDAFSGFKEDEKGPRVKDTDKISGEEKESK